MTILCHDTTHFFKKKDELFRKEDNNHLHTIKMCRNALSYLMNKSKDYSHIIKYASIFGGIQGLCIITNIVRNKFVAMILGPMGMGLASLFNSTSNLFYSFVNLGLPTSGVKSISALSEELDLENIDKENVTPTRNKLHETVSLLRSWSLLMAVFGTLLCAVFGSLLDTMTFSWGSHVLHYIALSPAVAFLVIGATEMAILKGIKKLECLGTISFLNIIIALTTSIPIYYIWGEAGIVPSLVLLAFVSMVLTLFHTIRIFPYRITLSASFLKKAMPTIRLGMAFVIAGVMGSGVEFVIRAFINHTSSLREVGLYNAAYAMTLTYAGLIFTSMETDYFPRLSALWNNKVERSITVNRQIEVSLLLVSPLLVFFMMGIPVLLPLLYSGRFLPVVGMMQILVLAIYLRAVKLPIAYMPLAKGDSVTFMTLEAIYDIALLVVFIIMYPLWGLTGAGIAILVTALFDFLMLMFYARIKYEYTVSREVWLYMAVQFLIGGITYCCTFLSSTPAYYISGTILTLISSLFSYMVIRKKTNLMEALKAKITKKLRRIIER